MTGARPSKTGNQGRGMPRYRQNGALSAFSRRQPPASIALARGDGDLPLAKLIEEVILASEPPESGECRFIWPRDCWVMSHCQHSGPSDVKAAGQIMMKLARLGVRGAVARQP